MANWKEEINVYLIFFHLVMIKMLWKRQYRITLYQNIILN